MGIGVVVTNQAGLEHRGSVVYANAAACQLLGIQSEYMIGQVAFGTSIGPASFAATLQSATSTAELIDVAGEIIRRDGERIEARWTATPSSGTERTVHLFTRTERDIGVEQALRESEQRFRQLMDIAPDGMLVISGRRIEYANEAITRIHGYSHPRQLPQLDLPQLFHAEDLELLDSSLDAIDQDPQVALSIQARALHRDGHSVLVEIVLYRIEWDDSKAVLATVRDIAGRKLIQSQLVHTDRLAAVGTLAAGVAHEINNPLAYVLLNLQYLIREVPKLATNDERLGHLVERLREARHGAERVVSIVKDLRTFSNVDEEQLGPVELRRVLMSAIKVARSQLMDKGEIVEMFNDVRSAYGHSARLEQVFLNLLINAIQALPHASASTNRIIVRLREERRGSHEVIVVEVADNGAGIIPENLDRVFDPFFTTKPVGLGTGLGLPICHSIVTRMGGAIRVESSVGQGTTFYVTLPVEYAERRATPYSLSPVPSRLARRARILVVDDELAVATMLSRILGEDHDVETASSAEQALRQFDEFRFDIVFCDLLMPGMTGMDLFAEVAKRHPGHERRIVFMTGGAFTPRAAQFLSRVANPRIEKPFDLQAVRSILRELLQHSGPVS
jgi:PAS domain S-box-containing protein